MPKKYQQPQVGFQVAKPPSTDPDERTLSAISIRLTGTMPLEQDYQSQVLDTGWGSSSPWLQSISFSGGPGGQIPISQAVGIPTTAGTSEATVSETLVSHEVRLPQDLEVYLGGMFESLAIGCFYLLLDMARVQFPSSSRSAPSQKVWVFQKAPTLLRPGDAALFPLVVDWRRWNRAVVPVLKDERWSPLIPINNQRVAQGSYSEFIALLEGSLLQSFKDAGYLPQDLA